MVTSSTPLTARIASAVLAVVVTAPAAAQPPVPPDKPKSQVPTLGRPTKPDDPAPLLDFMLYFKGAWNVTWDYPESPLGPADVSSGTTVYTEKGPTTFEATTQFENSAGTYTVTEVFEYQKEQRTLTHTVTDSRGFRYTQKGTVNGDLGGQFTIRLDGEPFTFKGQSLRLNSVMRLLSPFNYRTQFHLSVGDGAFANYGNPWWRKETSR
jgi:hypothetical protein